jgi:hypothetical protein
MLINVPPTCQAATKGTVGYDCDPRLLDRLHEVPMLDIYTEWPKLHLHCDKLVTRALDSLGTPQRIGAALAEPDVFDFAFIHKFSKRLHNNFDWHGGINAMLVIKVNIGDMELFEGTSDGFPNV